MSNIGKVIKGYCNGYFGRDDYENKVIVYETDTAICCKYLDNDNLTVANFETEKEKTDCIRILGHGGSIGSLFSKGGPYSN